MRDLDAFLNSLVNIDRNSLIAILSSEAEAARQSVNAARQRRLSFGVSIDRCEVRSTVSSISWRSSQTQFVLCVTTMKRAKATIGISVIRKRAIHLLIPRHC